MSMDNASIRERVAKRIKRRYDFYRHLGSFLTTNLILWGIYLVTNNFQIHGTPWPLWVTFFWGIGLVSDGIRVFSETRFLDDMREREFQRELEREHQRVYGDADYEKPKRGAVALGDDGELVYEGEDEASASQSKQKLR